MLLTVFITWSYFSWWWFSYPARLQLRLLPRPLSDEAVALLASLLLQILQMNSLAFVVILLSVIHLRHVIGRELRKGGVHWLMHFPAKFKYMFCHSAGCTQIVVVKNVKNKLKNRENAMKIMKTPKKGTSEWPGDLEGSEESHVSGLTTCTTRTSQMGL